MKILKHIIATMLFLNCAEAFSAEQKTDFLSFKGSDFRACDAVIMTVDEITPKFEALLKHAISGPVQSNPEEMIYFDDSDVEQYKSFIFYIGSAVNDANMTPFLEAMDQMALLPGFKWGCRNYK
ncbi:MAG: hypothetical protein ACXVCP_02220 [Bdellovibrio sp.]